MGLTMYATAEEIRSTYQVLVKVWHPDRFQGDAGLKNAGEAKLKEINAAYTLLGSARWKDAPPRRERPGAGEAASAQSAPAADEPVEQPAKKKPAAKRRFKWGWVGWAVPATWIAIRLALVLVALLIGRYTWIALDAGNTATGPMASVYRTSEDGLREALRGPKMRILAAMQQDWNRIHPHGVAPIAWQPPPEPVAAADAPSGQGGMRKAWVPRSAPSGPGVRRILPYITVGSTRQEVMDMLGAPTALADDKLVYGKSELYLRNGRVAGWRIDPVANPIRVKLWPSGAVDTSLDFFTIGDSKDIVLVVQGTPTAFSKDKFEYGGSEVDFENGEVVSWKEDPNSIRLRALGR